MYSDNTTPVPHFDLLKNLLDKARYNRQTRDFNDALKTQRKGDRDVYRFIKGALIELIP